MVLENRDHELEEIRLRRVSEALNADYVVHTQKLALIKKSPVYVNIDNGDVSYGKAPSALVDNASTNAVVLASSSNSNPMQTADSEAGFRRARIGVVAVIVIVLFWIWFRQRQSAS